MSEIDEPDEERFLGFLHDHKKEIVLGAGGFLALILTGRVIHELSKPSQESVEPELPADETSGSS